MYCLDNTQGNRNGNRKRYILPWQVPRVLHVLAGRGSCVFEIQLLFSVHLLVLQHQRPTKKNIYIERNIAVSGARGWDHRSRKGIIEPVTSCHSAQVAGLYYTYDDESVVSLCSLT